jgi:hypothetical protein
VTSDRAADDRLRTAFYALGESARDDCTADELDRIWRAVSGELPPDERRDVVERVAASPACAEAWRVAHLLWTEAQGGAVAQEGSSPAPPTSRTWTAPSWLAAAAVLLIGVGVAVVSQVGRESGDTFRDSTRYGIESLVPAGTTLARDAFRLRWTPGPDGSRYDVRVTTEDLQVLESVSGLTAPELALDRELLTPVAAGGRVLWQVDVTLPSGVRVSSQTFIVRVQ